MQQEARVATAIEVTFSFLFSFLRFVFVPGHAAPRGQPEKELREGAHRARGDQEGLDRTQAPCGENFFLLFLLSLLIEHDVLVLRISFSIVSFFPRIGQNMLAVRFL